MKQKNKKLWLLAAMMMATMAVHAQITVAEPEFVNSYCILTSDSTLAVLPKENGTIGKGKNKAQKASEIAGAASGVVAGAGILSSLSSKTKVLKGALKLLKLGRGASEIAGAAGTLAGAEGMDIVFSGPESSYVIPVPTEDVNLIIKGANNETDPMEVYRIVRFNQTKKDRRIRWIEFKPALLGSSEAEESGYLGFAGHKYGEQSYLLTIPASELTAGEYGIFFMSIITASTIPVGTFSVQ